MHRISTLRKFATNVRPKPVMRNISNKVLRQSDNFSAGAVFSLDEVPIRSEYQQMSRDFDHLCEEVKEMSLEYYKACGTPQ